MRDHRSARWTLNPCSRSPADPQRAQRRVTLLGDHRRYRSRRPSSITFGPRAGARPFAKRARVDRLARDPPARHRRTAGSRPRRAHRPGRDTAAGRERTRGSARRLHRPSSCRRSPARPPAGSPAAPAGRRTPGTSARPAARDLVPGRPQDVGQPGPRRDQPPHRIQRHRGRRAQEAVMPHFLEPRRQDVLQEPAEELHRVQRHLPLSVRSHPPIA